MMAKSFTAFLPLLLILATNVFGNLVAQEEEPIRPNVEVSPLKTFHLLGKDGEPIPYFKITFEEFEKIFKILRSGNANDDIQEFSIRAVEIITKVRGRSANLEIRFNIDFKADGEYRIPIGFDNVLFPPNAGSNDIMRKDGKYYLLVKGKKNQENRFTIFGKKRLIDESNATTVRLNLPAAAFAKMQIHTVQPRMQFRIPEGAFSAPVKPLFENGSSIEIQGINDQTSISWSETATNMGMKSPAIAQIEAIATVGPNGVANSSTLSLSSTNEINGFRFALPVNATDIEISPAAYQIQPDNGTSKYLTYFFLKFPASRTQIENLTISWVVPRPSQSQRGLEQEVISGLDFPDFRIDAGTLSISSPQGQSFGIRNEFNLENRIVNSVDQSLTFEFRTALYSANLIRFNPIPSLDNSINYRLEVGTRSATLNIEVTKELISTHPTAILNLQDWSIEAENPGVSGKYPFLALKSLLTQSARQSEKVVLTQKITSDSNNTLELPYIDGIPRLSNRLSLIGKENTELLFDSKQNSDFKPSSDFELEKIVGGKSLDLTSNKQGKLQLALNIKRIPTKYSATQSIRIEENRGQYWMKTTHRIRSDRPLESVVIGFDPRFSPTVQLSGKNLLLEGFPDGLNTYYVFNVEPNLDLILESQVSLEQFPNLHEVEARLPVILLPNPANQSDAATNSTSINGRSFKKVNHRTLLEIRTSPGKNLSPDSRWNQDTTIQTDFYASHYQAINADSILFSETISDEDDLQVEKIWCHTSITSEFRQDRIAIRFKPRNSLIQWNIPDGSKLLSCQLDGKPISESSSADNRSLTVGFNEFSKSHVIVFLIRYFSAGSSSTIQLNLPKSKRVLWTSHLYWSFDLPDNQYIWTNSNNLSVAFTVSGGGIFLRPAPTMKPVDLERWIGQGKTSDAELKNADYLFSSFGVTDLSSVNLVSKRRLVIFFGLFFLAAGYALVWIPVLRNPFSMVTAAGVLLILGVWYPIWFVQLLQVEILAGFLVCLGLAIARLTNWFGPKENETRIETNVPSIALASPDSNVGPSTHTHIATRNQAEDSK